MQYLNVHIDAHETIMSTFSNQTELDMIRMWLEGKESNGILQALEEKYDTFYYGALRKKDDTNIGPKNVNDKVVRQIKIIYNI